MQKIKMLVAIASTVTVTGFAQSTTALIDAFDPSGTGGNSYASGQITNVWMNWFGDAFRSVSWDPNTDANSNPNSGSMKIIANFDGNGAIPNQFEIFDGYNGINPPISAVQYTNFQCDVRFDPGSATVVYNGTSVFGYLMFGTRNGYNQDYFGGIMVPASNTNWVHVSFPLNAASDTNLTNITDVLIHIYGPSLGSPGLSGTVTLWVDNIKFTSVSTNCTVNWNDTHQRIDGFGASSAWGSMWTTAQADMFFSTNTGAGLSLLRNRIAPDGTTWETSIMQMARDRGARVWSTPFSPPAAYKDSGTVDGGNFLSADNQAYANQLAQYVANMKNSYGVNIYAISVQNEPDYSTTNYEDCTWTPAQIHDFIPYLYSALSNNGVSSTKIMIAENSTWKFDYTTNSMNDLVTSNEVGILAAHAYNYVASPVNNNGKPLWETEVSTIGDTYDGSITNALFWANQIHAFMTVAQVNAWNYWWLISFNPDNEGLTDTTGNPAKRMYVLGQYSRFVRPGYYRIGVTNGAPTFISAYKDPNSGCFAIVAINADSFGFSQTFNLNGFNAANVTPWITSGSLSLASQPSVNVTNATFTYTLPAMSVVTFVGQANATIPTLALNRAGPQIGLTFNGDAGWNYTLLTSTNLSDWQPLLLTNPTVMPVMWFDTNSISNARFYRVQFGQ
jgi:glucuronoarabinoxylan endo-1,4-beta-xylanase